MRIFARYDESYLCGRHLLCRLAHLHDIAGEQAAQSDTSVGLWPGRGVAASDLDQSDRLSADVNRVCDVCSGQQLADFSDVCPDNPGFDGYTAADAPAAVETP